MDHVLKGMVMPRFFCGKSGSGKSTQALIEMMEGSRLISEDICNRFCR